MTVSLHVNQTKSTWHQYRPPFRIHDFNVFLPSVFAINKSLELIGYKKNLCNECVKWSRVLTEISKNRDIIGVNILLLHTIALIWEWISSIINYIALYDRISLFFHESRLLRQNESCLSFHSCRGIPLLLYIDSDFNHFWQPLREWQ